MICCRTAVYSCQISTAAPPRCPTLLCSEEYCLRAVQCNRLHFGLSKAKKAVLSSSESNFPEDAPRDLNPDLTPCCIFVRSLWCLQLRLSDRLVTPTHSPISIPKEKKLETVLQEPSSERKVSSSPSLPASAALSVWRDLVITISCQVCLSLVPIMDTGGGGITGGNESFVYQQCLSLPLSLSLSL